MRMEIYVRKASHGLRLAVFPVVVKEDLIYNDDNAKV